MNATSLVGSTRVCLTHFRDSSKSPRAAHDQFRARFPTLPRETSWHWFNTATLPLGVRLIQLQTFLQEQGYTLTELHILPEYLIKIRAQVSAGELKVEDIKRTMAYKTTNQVYMLLAGKITLFRGRQKEGLEKLIGESLPSQGNSKPKALTPKNSSAQNGEALFIEEVPSVLSPTAFSKEEVKRILASLARAIQPLAEIAASDLFTPEDREEIRQLAGPYTMFHTTNALNKLCGERARQQINASKSKSTSNRKVPQ